MKNFKKIISILLLALFVFCNVAPNSNPAILTCGDESDIDSDFNKEDFTF